MPRSTHPKPSKGDWQSSALWKAGNNIPNILIPLEVDNSKYITGFVVLDDIEFPEEGQNILFDYAGSSFRESQASLTIHRELRDPTLEDGYTLTLLKIAHSIDLCNGLSQNHSVKAAFWARQIASKIGFTQEKLDEIELAGRLHDIGKVIIPKSVLTKPARLSEEERLVMHRHSTYGAMIMKPSLRLHPIIPFVKSHHEFYDGSGYPSGQSGYQIPIQARILSVADAYSTMTEARVYRPASSSAEALRELIRWSGKQFDPELVTIMIDLITAGEIDDSHCAWESEYL